MYSKHDKLTMLIGAIGLVLVLALAHNQGQSQDIVRAHEYEYDG